MTDIPSVRGQSSHATPSENRIEPDVFGRYLTGEATPEDRARLAQWATTSHRRRLLAASREVPWSDSARTARVWEVLRQRLGIGADLSASGDVRTPEATGAAGTFGSREAEGPGVLGMAPRLASHSPRLGRWFPRWRQISNWRWPVWQRSIVAAFAAGAAVAVWLGVTRTSPSVSSTMTHYATRTGQRAMVTIADGTSAMLAPGTTLSVASSAHSIDVSLVGEAYFTVAHRSSMAFVVHTGAVTTRVLGTAFDVRRYREDSQTRVVVTAGKVSTGRERMHTLVAGTLAYVSDSTTMTSAIGDTAELTGWTQGRLVFHNAPVPDVLAAIGRWYGTTIRIAAPALAHQRVTTLLDVRGTRSELLAVLETVLDVQFTAAGDTLLVTARRTSQRPASARRTGSIFSPKAEVGR